MLDIGGDMGAVVVYLPEPPPSGELEAEPVDRPGARFHTGVHWRPVADTWAHVAVFAQLSEGEYQLLDHDGAPTARLAVRGAEVTELDLR